MSILFALPVTAIFSAPVWWLVVEFVVEAGSRRVEVVGEARDLLVAGNAFAELHGFHLFNMQPTTTREQHMLHYHSLRRNVDSERLCAFIRYLVVSSINAAAHKIARTHSAYQRDCIMADIFDIESTSNWVYRRSLQNSSGRPHPAKRPIHPQVGRRPVISQRERQHTDTTISLHTDASIKAASTGHMKHCPRCRFVLSAEQPGAQPGRGTKIHALSRLGIDCKCSTTSTLR